jgi:phospholipid/cholesterol/gamma-HCH transport system substrate-binding protein
MAKPFRFRHVNEITGAFVLGVAALLVLGVAGTGYTQRWFTRTTEFTMLLPTGAQGLRPGAEVQMLGTVVGSVQDIWVDKVERRMKARVSVRSDFAEMFVKTDSRALLRRPFGIGETYVEIRGGGAEAEKMPAHSAMEATAEGAPTESLEKTIVQIRDEVVPGIQEARRGVQEFTALAAEMRRPDSNLQQSFARLNRIFSDVEKGEGLAGKVLSDPEMAAEVQKTMKGLNASLTEAQAVLLDLRKTTNTVAGQSQQSLDQFQAILKDIQKTTAAMPQTVKSINQTTEAMPAMVLQMQETLRQIQRLVEGAQRSWILRGTIEREGAGGAGGVRIRPEDVGGGGRR